MPASKRSHVLALLRAALSLKQTELADLADCSLATIQSVELNRLTLSNSLAARISAATGVDLGWLLSNDLSRPVPPIRALSVKSKLIEEFRNLFARARLTAEGPERETLAFYIAWELNRLKTEPYPALTPEMERQIEEAERPYEEDKRKQEKEPVKELPRNPKKNPKASGSEKASALPLKAPRRTPRSL